jgi:hypothetical protein
MASPATLQQALRLYLDTSGLDTQRRKVCGHLLACRTEAMGETLLRCERCQSEQHRYHGCRDRHCPQCQGRATRLWTQRQREAVLPVAYFHLVFTLPEQLNGWMQLHPEVMYRLLFACAWGTLKRFGEDPKRLGGQMGMSAVLHTWGQTLGQHVHLHCLVPGGALGSEGEWRRTRGNYLFPVKALSRHFRGKMVSALRASAEAGELVRVTHPGEVGRQLDALMARDWVVYTKPCLNHTETVVEYLGRYTHRIAISNARILAVDKAGVTIRYQDYRDGGRHKTMHLDGEEFVRRYLLHILPKGLMRVRHYGFLANRCRVAKLAQIREVLEQDEAVIESGMAHGNEEGYPCPVCKTGRLRLVATLPARPVWKAMSLRR